MKKLILVLFFLALFSLSGRGKFLPAQEAEASSFSYCRSITIDHTQCGNSDSSNFPVLVSLSDTTLMSAGNGGHVQNSNGYDIYFYSDSGLTQRLPAEREYYNASTGNYIGWVQLPTVSHTTNTVFYIAYGDATISSDPNSDATYGATNVWDSNYIGVWHYNQTGANPQIMDSTSNANNSASNASTPTASGKIDGAATFNGTANVTTFDSAKVFWDYTNASGNTYECWVNISDYSGGNDFIPTLAELAADAAHNTNTFGIYIANYAGYNGLNISCNNTMDYGNGNLASTSTGTWHHVVVVFAGGTYNNIANYTVYLDGSVQTMNSHGGWYSYAGNVNYFGTDGGAGDYLNGILDEVRISKIARGADWILTEYNNQNNPGNIGTPGFYTVGSETPTLVTLISFSATEYYDGIQLNWRTGYEVNNLGFHVYCEENGGLVRLTPELVAGSALQVGSGTKLTAGHSYSWWDFPVSAQQSAVRLKYWLEDVDLYGKRTWHGPVIPVYSGGPLPKAVKPELLSELSRRLNEKYEDFWRVQDLRAKLTSKRLEAKGAALRASGMGASSSKEVFLRQSTPFSSRTETDLQTQLDLASRPAVKLLVKEEGWHRVSQSELIAAGLSSRANPRNLQLYLNGREQPIKVLSQKKRGVDSLVAVEFCGVGLDTPSTDTQVYWLVEGARAGKRIQEIKGQGGSSGSPSFPYTVEKKDRVFYFASLNNGEADSFFGPMVTTDPVDQVLVVLHSDPSPPGDPVLEVALQGFTTDPHRVGVFFNDVNVGEVVLQGQSSGSVRLPVPYSLLLEGDNLLTLVAEGGETDISLIDSIRLTYWHTYTADQDALRFSAQGAQQVTIGGFSGAQIRVIDNTDLGVVQEVVGLVGVMGSGYAIKVQVPGRGSRSLMAFTEGQVMKPAFIVANHPSSWSQSRVRADLVIISHKDFLDAIQPLKVMRQGQGLPVVSIDVEDLYDEFNFGVKSPQAIKDFLTHAKTKWSRPPRFVLLVGDASFDPKNYLGFGYFDFLPTKQVWATYFKTASDDWFVDLNNDGLPDLAIGRVPVRTKEEADVVVSKIISYEQGAGGVMRDALLVADINDGFDFEATTEELRALLPSSITVQKILRSQFSTDADAKNLLISILNQGPLLVNYFGHGSEEIWRGSLLTSEDAPSLTNGTRLSFLIGMTCLNGLFHDVYLECLAKAMLKAERGGAVAVWASSALTEPGGQAVMDKELVRLLFGRGGLTLGEATMRAKKVVTDTDIRRTWILFGDPTIRLK